MSDWVTLTAEQYAAMEREIDEKDAEIERLNALFEATRFDKKQHAEALDEIERLREALFDIANRGVPVQREEHRIARAALNTEDKG